MPAVSSSVVRIHALRPLVVDIAAPQVLVFEMASATTGTLPGSPPHSAELLERDGDDLIVRYRTPAFVTELVLVERVRLYPPERHPSPRWDHGRQRPPPGDPRLDQPGGRDHDPARRLTDLLLIADGCARVGAPVSAF